MKTCSFVLGSATLPTVVSSQWIENATWTVDFGHHHHNHGGGCCQKVQTEWSEIIHFASHERLLFWAPFSLARCLVELTDNRPQNYTTSPEIYSINQLKPALSVLIRSAQSVTHAHTWVLCNRCFRMSGLLMAAVDPNPSSQSARNICTTSPAHSLSLSPSLIMTEQFRGRC